MVVLLALVPWLGLMAALPFLLPRRPSLSSYEPAAGEDPPLVTIVLPTHNDADRVGACLATLLDSSYPRYEVVVADAGSEDGTRDVVRSLEARAPKRVRLVEASRGPDDWPARAWACQAGFRAAAGARVLFTDPGTVHDTEVLGRAVTAMDRESVDLVTVYPRVTMHGFWERLVAPHVRLLVAARFPSARRVNRTRDPRGAVVSYPFLLFRAEAYEAVGGHAVMRGGGRIEDLAIAQAVVQTGRRIFLVHGEEYLETRVFRGLGEIAHGWIGSLPAAARSTVRERVGRLIPWLLAAAPLAFFVAPPVALAAALLAGWSGVTPWAACALGLSTAFWLVLYARYHIRPAYAVAHPLGALATSAIFIASLLRRPSP